MQPYRPLPEQIAEQIAHERTIIVELDSWYLPDTAATSYRREHVKSSVVAESIDRDGERLRYFHGPGYYELEGEDYRGIFRLGRAFSEDVLPPYTELVRLDAGSSPQGRCAARGGTRAARREPRAAAASRTRSSASARSSQPISRACSRATTPPTTTMRSRPSAWSAPRSRSAARTWPGCSARPERPPWRRWSGSSMAARSSRSSSRGGALSTQSRRSQSWRRAWDEAFAALDGALA